MKNLDWWEERADEVNAECATLSVEDGKIRIYCGRVDREIYDKLIALKFQRAHTQGCFYASWSPYVEDVALALCGDIEDETMTLAERTEARAERSQGYANNAASRGTAADERARRLMDGIPLGQPILVGHHSEKRHRAHVKRIDSALHRAWDEMKKAGYWQRRADAAKARADLHERPDVVTRRIKKLEAMRRKYAREREFTVDNLNWSRDRYAKDVLGKEGWDWTLTEAEELGWRATVTERAERHHAWTDRWIAFLDMRLEYERALYDEGDGLVVDRKQPGKGDWVQSRHGWMGPVSRVNKGRDGNLSSVSVPHPFMARATWQVKADEITEILTAEEWEEKDGKAQ